jgi:acetyltransferase-like isoleucine patch superfamily enzyme
MVVDLPLKASGYLVGLTRRAVRWIDVRRQSRMCVLGAETQLLDGARIHNFRGAAASIAIGDGCRVAGELLVFAHGGQIRIGNACYIGQNSRIWSARSVSIGNHVLISHNVNIHDTNSHAMSAAARRAHIDAIFRRGHPADLPDVADAPITIGDDVWIGFNAIVLKGVNIGRGAVVGAGSVVTKDVAPFSVVVGAPARVVGSALE